MNYATAAALAGKINASEALPIRQGWFANKRAILRQQEDGKWDGDWQVTMEHRSSENAYLIANEDDWKQWLALALLFGVR